VSDAPGARALVVVTGKGGVGKSTLAAAIGHGPTGGSGARPMPWW
jgi:septum formation inhibitor-activating ATPase MinD